VLGNHRGDPILVLLAPAQQADLCVLDPQEDSVPLLDLLTLLYHL
jgi:hypothetical protein